MMWRLLHPGLKKLFWINVGIVLVSFLWFAIHGNWTVIVDLLRLIAIAIPFPALIALVLTLITALQHCSLRLAAKVLMGAVLGWCMSVTTTLALFFWMLSVPAISHAGPGKGGTVLLLLLGWNLLVAIGTGLGAQFMTTVGHR
jgi:hypothetical protein